MCFFNSLGLLIVEVCFWSRFSIFLLCLRLFFLFFITVFTAFYGIQVAIVDLGLLLKSRKEDVLYTFLCEVLVPVLDQFRA